MTEKSKPKFRDLPSAGLWEDRTEEDEELLEELGGMWRGFAEEDDEQAIKKPIPE